MRHLAAPLSIALLLSACSTPAPVVDTAPRPTEGSVPKSTVKAKVAPRWGGGYYKDDGPGDEIPDNLDQIPDAVPRWEPLHKPALRPYEVFGKRYVPETAVKPFSQRGIASWYGRKFHGQKTSIGEPYDMFAMTAAHPTLPLPSYVRVTNTKSGKSVVLRVIDRGPFHVGRVIDLSYTAAYKLGIIQGGSAEVEVTSILPGEPTSTTYAAVTPPAAPPPVASSPAVTDTPPSGTYLQLGAFANADNADNMKQHMARELDWINEPWHIVRAGTLHRVQIGPYALRSEAEAMAERIRSAVGYKPGIVIR